MATENLPPQIISRVMTEIRELARAPPEGIVYEETESSSVTEIYAIIDGPEETPYVGGKFRMKLVLSDEVK